MGLPLARMDRMTTSGGSLATSYLRRLRAHWPGLLLPLLVAGGLGVVHGLSRAGPDGIRGPWPILLIIGAGLLAILAPVASARIAPLALLAFGAWGVCLVHFLRYDEFN